MNRFKNIEEIIEGFKLVRQHLRPTVSGISELSLTHSQWLALAVVGRGYLVTVSNLRNALGISSSAATQLANSLERKGHIKRLKHPTDGRVSVLALTSHTKKIFATMRKKKLKEFRVLFDVFSDKEFILYLKLHKKLIKSIS